jgi:ribonuclease P protein component
MLSTAHEPPSAQAVDDFAIRASPPASSAGPGAWWGAVVPKRHARRSVTRTLIKRQIRAALSRREAPGQRALRAGIWVVRLRAPFDRNAFASAASSALRLAARSELDGVLGQAERKLVAAPPAHIQGKIDLRGRE